MVFDSAELRTALVTLGAITVYTVPPFPFVEFPGLFANEHSTIPLFGETISTDGPSLLVVTSDAPEKNTVLSVNEKHYRVYDQYILDDGALTLLELKVEE